MIAFIVNLFKTSKFADIWIHEFDHSDLVGPAAAIETIKKMVRFHL